MPEEKKGEKSGDKKSGGKGDKSLKKSVDTGGKSGKKHSSKKKQIDSKPKTLAMTTNQKDSRKSGAKATKDLKSSDRKSKSKGNKPVVAHGKGPQQTEQNNKVSLPNTKGKSKKSVSAKGKEPAKEMATALIAPSDYQNLYHAVERPKEPANLDPDMPTCLIAPNDYVCYYSAKQGKPDGGKVQVPVVPDGVAKNETPVDQVELDAEEPKQINEGQEMGEAKPKDEPEENGPENDD